MCDGVRHATHSMTSIHLATREDAALIAAIYAPHCSSTAVSFEVDAPSADEIAKRIAATTAQYPWLVLADDGVVAGYAYASRHRDRAAYQWSVDVAVYVDRAHHRRGVGRALYTTLFELLRHQRYFKAYGGITLPNPSSVGLHEAVGFTLVGVYRGVGYKLGAWHDVAWFQKVLQPEHDAPAPPSSVSSIGGSEWQSAIARGLQQYRPNRGA
jgi:L-amino acid N-acyltransferase YncA